MQAAHLLVVLELGVTTAPPIAPATMLRELPTQAENLLAAAGPGATAPVAPWRWPREWSTEAAESAAAPQLLGVPLDATAHSSAA